MTATISKWGNSQGLRFPKDIMQFLQLSIGDKVELKTEGNRVIIESVEKKKYDINELVQAMPSDYTPCEELDDFIGKEEW